MGQSQAASAPGGAAAPERSAAWDADYPLTDEQRAAIEYTGGPLIVLAGPGSGKTRVLVGRVAHLVAPRERGGRGADPASVLAVTFTVKAAEELRARLHDLLGFHAAEGVQASTFHSLGRRLIRRFGDLLDLPPELLVMDSAMQRRLLRQLMGGMDAYRSRASEGFDRLADDALLFMHTCKQCALDAAGCEAATRAWRERFEACAADMSAEERDAEAARIELCERRTALYARFEEAALPRGLITLDDYMLLPLRILRKSDAVRAILRSEIRHIVVDEFQDVNAAQIELLRLIAPAGADICVVGDDDQAIYAFRGADTRAFARFARIWPGYAERRLTHNFRSAPRIVQVGNEIIHRANERFAPDKSIVAASPAERAMADLPPFEDEGAAQGVIIDLRRQREDGDAVAAIILAEKAANPEKPWRDFGVIVRGGAPCDRTLHALEFRGVPVSTRRMGGAADDPQVRTLLAWLRVVANPDDGARAQQALHAPPISAPGERLIDWAQEHRAQRRQNSKGAVEASFARWLMRRHGGEPSVRRFAEIFSRLRDRAAVATAEELARDAVRLLGLGAALAAHPRTAARSVSHLAGALRFIGRITRSLDSPADIHAFWEHYDDLNDNERAMELAGDERVDTPPDAADEEQDAVALLTAHGAKGLEFDTVIVVGVRPRAGTGFPSSKRADDVDPFDMLPPGVREERDDLDEERRLFYVACTRAKRRLFLIAASKQKPTAGDFFCELEAAEPPLKVTRVDEWRKWAREVSPDEMQAYLRERAVADELARARLDDDLHRARAEAVAALHEIETSVNTASERAAACKRLLAAADELATLGALARQGEPPAFLEDDALAHDRRESLAALAQRHIESDAWTDVVQPMKPPLDLSYSAIELFRQCPRCFYARHVLGLEEPPARHIILGSLVHRALHSCFGALREGEAEGRPPNRAALLGIASRELDRAAPRQRLDDEARLEALAMVENALDMHEQGAEILELEKAAVFEHHAGEAGAHRFSARIDRIDRLPDGGIRIVDYKTGKPTGKKLEPEKTDLQLGVYALALPAIFGTDEPIEGVAEYWLLSTGERGAIDLAELNLTKVRSVIDAAIESMLAGRFPRGKKRGKWGGCRDLCAILGPG